MDKTANRGIATEILEKVADYFSEEINEKPEFVEAPVALDTDFGKLQGPEPPAISIIYYDRKDWNGNPKIVSFFVALYLRNIIYPITGEWTERSARHSAEGIEMVSRMLFKLPDTGFEISVSQSTVTLFGKAKGSWDFPYNPNDDYFVDKTAKVIIKDIEDLEGFIQGTIEAYIPFEKMKLKEAADREMDMDDEIRVSWLDKNGEFDPLRFGDFDSRDFTIDSLIDAIRETFPEMEEPSADEKRKIMIWMRDNE
jgi:hypothetical protein